MRALLIAATAALAAGCASAPARPHAAAPLFRIAPAETPATAFLAALPPKPATEEIALPAAPGARKGTSLEIRFEASDGTTVLAPRITAFHGQRANVQVLRQTAFVADFDIEKKDGAAIVNPIIAMAEDGIRLEMRALPADRGTLLSWSLRVARPRLPMDLETYTDLQGNRLSIQLPTTDRSEAGGARLLEEGTWGLLARLPDGKGGSLTVTARATTEDLEFSSKEEDARDLALVEGGARPAPAPGGPALAAPRPGAPTGILELRAVTLRTDLPAGSVVEGAAAAAAGVEPLEPGDLALATQWVPGARAACLLDEAWVQEYLHAADPPPETVDPVVATRTSGLEASVGEDGVLGISWTTTPRWDRFSYSPAGTGDPRHFSVEEPWSATHRARVAQAPGTRLVVLAALPGGRAAAVLVRFRPE